MEQSKLIFSWNNEQNVVEISNEMIQQLEEIFHLIAKQEDIQAGEVVVSFVDDQTIQELNRQYRGIDKVTDVLSFSMLEHVEDDVPIVYTDLCENEDIAPLGDIVISAPRTMEQAHEYGHSLSREFGFLFAHGLFHLIGYDHQSEAEEVIMFAKQESILQKVGLTR
jgi:probable rRNA maturation factor